MKNFNLLILIFFMNGCASGDIALNKKGEAANVSDAGLPPIDPIYEIEKSIKLHEGDRNEFAIKNVRGPVFSSLRSFKYWGEADYGWSICFDVNFRMESGVYSGYKRGAILWRDGIVKKYFIEKDFLSEKYIFGYCSVVEDKIKQSDEYKK